MENETDTQPNLKAAFGKPTWNMTKAEKAAFVRHHGNAVWENKLKNEIPDPKDKAAYQEWKDNLEAARRRDDPYGFRR